MKDVQIIILALAAHIDQIVAECKDPETEPHRRSEIIRELCEWYNELQRLTKNA